MTKNQFKEKTLQGFDNKFGEQIHDLSLSAHAGGNITDDIKSLISQSLDEIVELAFRECKMEEELSQYIWNRCIGERSKLEKLFKGEL